MDDKGCWYYADELGIGMGDLPGSNHPSNQAYDKKQWRKCEARYNRLVSGQETNQFTQVGLEHTPYQGRSRTISPPSISHTHKDYVAQWESYLNEQLELANPAGGSLADLYPPVFDCSSSSRAAGNCVRMGCLNYNIWSLQWYQRADEELPNNPACIPRQVIASSIAEGRC
jgi:hypothetical protein